MQSYGQQGNAGCQRPGSTLGFPGTPAPPPPYAAPQEYQSAAPQTPSQWAPPAQNQTPGQQWSQTSQAGGYNPGGYGTMPGEYSQGQSALNYNPAGYPPQQDVPPPPPPKPAGFAAAVHQQQSSQNLGQQATHGAQQPQQGFQAPQQNTGYTQGLGGYPQHGGYLVQGVPQSSYNTAAPPPPSQTPGGSYFPTSQIPQQPARPGSMYAINQSGLHSYSTSAVTQAPASSVLSPNEQQPAYIPPSLTGQGTQSYIPANTNPLPGVYVPPPPDVPAWQQAQHAPLQGGKKFKYTRPSAGSGSYGQGYQGTPPVQQQGQYVQQPQYATHSPMQQHGAFGQVPQMQQQGLYGQTSQAPYGQVVQSQAPFPQQTPPSYNQAPPSSHTPQQQFQQSSQWQAPLTEQGYEKQQENVQTPYNTQQQGWQPGHQVQGSTTAQQYPSGQDAGIQAPKPIGHAGTTPPGFVNQPSPQSQPVSPVQHRQSMSFNSVHNQAALGRTGSVSSIALGAIHAQRAGNRTESPHPKVPPPKPPTPPPPRDDATKFSALGTGGPSDWEHFGAEDEIDDEDMFGSKREENNIESVELPAQGPSPVSALSEVSSPPDVPVGLSAQSKVDRMTTPEQSGRELPVNRLVSQMPQQSFVIGDPVISSPGSTQSPQPMSTQSPPVQQSSVVNDGGWRQSQQSTPIQQQAQHQPPSNAQQRSGMGDASWTSSGSHPSSHQPLMNNSFTMHDGDQESSQQIYTHGDGAWEQQPNQTNISRFNANDDAYERLKAESENEKSSLRQEVEELKVVIETVRRHAESERSDMDEQMRSMKAAADQTKSSVESELKVLNDQITTMKTAAEQATSTAVIVAKEKDAAIERWKEDAEGKHENVKEKEATIVDLGQQIKERDLELTALHQQLQGKQAIIEGLNRQLEAEQLKKPPKPAPADLVADLDPWYAGSLERYIAMLRSEAHEPLVENKINTFTSFLKAESGIRGIEYYNGPPPAATAPGHVEQSGVTSQKGSVASTKPKNDLNVQIPEQVESLDDGFQYSPGGRPMLRRQTTAPLAEAVPRQQSVNATGEPSDYSTTVVTPTSSQDDGLGKPTPVQSPPEERSQSQYKAYVPPGVTQEQSTKMLHKQSMSFGSITPLSSLQTPGSGHNNDEIFFGGHKSQTSSNPASRPTTSTASDIPFPPPLFTPKPPSAIPPAPAQQDPLQVLAELIPARIATPQPNPQLEKVRQKMNDISSNFSFMQELTTTWERSAASTRKINDDARRKRQEESEEHTDQLFNDHEISYADIGDIEDNFKEKERQLKTQEDKEEYKTYGTSVFDKVYERLQEQIKTLTDIYIDAESLLQTSISGIKSLEGGDAATTEDSLKLLQQVHEHIELRHEKVVNAVTERDKRYKKTEVQPLYAAGNIAKMKAVEKHFENAERQAMARAKRERAERVGDFVRVAEEVVVGAVGVEQTEIDGILAAIRNLPSNSSENLLKRAHETLLALKKSSKSLLSLLNTLEIMLNTAEGNASVAQAKAENAGSDKVEEGVKEREKGLLGEYKRRVGVLYQDEKEIEELLAEKGGKAVWSEEDERKARLQRALEEAKKRNGDL